MGDSCFQGELQKSSPKIDTGDKRHCTFMNLALFAKDYFRFVIRWVKLYPVQSSSWVKRYAKV